VEVVSDRSQLDDEMEEDSAEDSTTLFLDAKSEI